MLSLHEHLEWVCTEGCGNGGERVLIGDCLVTNIFIKWLEVSYNTPEMITEYLWSTPKVKFLV